MANLHSSPSPGLGREHFYSELSDLAFNFLMWAQDLKLSVDPLPAYLLHDLARNPRQEAFFAIREHWSKISTMLLQLPDLSYKASKAPLDEMQVRVIAKLHDIAHNQFPKDEELLKSSSAKVSDRQKLIDEIEILLRRSKN